MTPEVLIYIQNLKKYFTDNESVMEYFGIHGKEEDFFNNIIELSEKNMEDHGDPQLSTSQFEEVRKKINYLVNVTTKIVMGIFISLGDYGYVALN